MIKQRNLHNGGKKVYNAINVTLIQRSMINPLIIHEAIRQKYFILSVSNAHRWYYHRIKEIYFWRVDGRENVCEGEGRIGWAKKEKSIWLSIESIDYNSTRNECIMRASGTRKCNKFNNKLYCHTGMRLFRRHIDTRSLYRRKRPIYCSLILTV